MAFRHVISDSDGKLRRNLGKSLGVPSTEIVVPSPSIFRKGLGQSSPVETIQYVAFPRTSAIRKGLGIISATSGGLRPVPVVSPVAISPTNLFAAYSVNRQIVSGYSGNLLRGILFDAGAQSTLDIGQSSGILNVSSIPENAFFVPTQVFDQSGNNNHLILNRQQSINSHHSLIYRSQKYAIDSNQVSFGLTTNWADASNICIYKEGSGPWGRGQDGFGGTGSGWSIYLSPNEFFIVSAAPTAYSTSFASTAKALGYVDWSGLAMGSITSTGGTTTVIPNSSFRSSSVGVLSNFGNGTLVSGWFAEFVVYNNALNGTNRQSLFDTLSA